MTRPLPAEMSERLASRVMTLSYAYLVTRADGQVYGFTDHDQALTVEGVLCRPETGFDPSTIDETLGATTDGTDIFGILDDERITRDDLELGLWDSAQVRLFAVDWRRPDLAHELSRQEVAEIRFGGGQVVAQLRSQLAGFNEETGRLIEHDCPFQFGDQDCGFDRSAVEFMGVVSGVGEDFITAAVAGAQESGFFDLGRVHFVAGGEAHVLNHTGSRLTFFAPLPVLPEIGAEIVVSQGCDRSWSACQRFGNTDNYGGFPFMLGSDAVVQSGDYPGQIGGVSQFIDQQPRPPENVRLLGLLENIATIGFDPAPVYVRALDPFPSREVYGRTGQLQVAGLPFDSQLTIEVVSVVGDLISDPVEVQVVTGPPPPPQGGGDGGGDNDQRGGDNDGDGPGGGVDGNDPDGDGNPDTGL